MDIHDLFRLPQSKKLCLVVLWLSALQVFQKALYTNCVLVVAIARTLFGPTCHAGTGFTPRFLL